MKLKTVVRKNNKVKGYYIENENGVKFISKEQLKQTMQVKGLLVEGLKLTRDGRLIESKKSRNPKDLKSPQISKEKHKVSIEQPKQAKNKLRFQLELRDKLGIAEPMIVEGIRYFIEDSKVCCKCGDRSITKANILEGTEIIRYSAFSCCVNLTTVNIPNSVTEVGNGAFYNCTNLKYVYCYKGSKADNPNLYPSKVTFKYL